jgi:hypothetical protein
MGSGADGVCRPLYLARNLRSTHMSSNAILDGRLWPRIGLEYAPTENLRFRDDLSNPAHLGSQLLLYDKVVLPTNDFGIVPALIHWLGLEVFLRGVEEGTFSFLRRRGFLGYVGNGNAISTLDVRPGPNNPFYPWQEAMFGESEKSIAIQLANTAGAIPATEHQRVLRSTLAASREFECDNDFFLRNIVHETYTDIMQTPEFSVFVLDSCPSGGRSIDLTRLPGVEANQVKCSSLGEIKNPVELVLRVAEVNLEIAMSLSVGGCDVFTCDGVDELLTNKLRRAAVSRKLADGFSRLLELNNVPDIERAVCDGRLPLKEIWAVRQTRESCAFREWLRKATADDARELEKAYVASLRRVPAISSWPAKIIRFCITSVWGLVEPISALAAGATDSFLVEKVLSGYSPKLFFDHLRSLKIPK